MYRMQDLLCALRISSSHRHHIYRHLVTTQPLKGEHIQGPSHRIPSPSYRCPDQGYGSDGRLIDLKRTRKKNNDIGSHSVVRYDTIRGERTNLNQKKPPEFGSDVEIMIHGVVV